MSATETDLAPVRNYTWTAAPAKASFAIGHLGDVSFVSDVPQKIRKATVQSRDFGYPTNAVAG